MDSGIIATWVSVAFVAIGGIVGFVIISVNLSARITAMAKDIEALQSDSSEHKAHNQRQHEELYSSRNNMDQSITRLSTILEMMVAKQDQMDRKIDTLLARREAPLPSDRN
jgi:mannitol-specific phosphotransferase system IIBC component